MSKLKKVLPLFLLGITLLLVSCNDNTKPNLEYKIPSLDNLTQEQIEDKFADMDIDVTLKFKDIYEPDFPEGTYYEIESHKIGDVIKDNDTIIIVLSQTKIKLNDLSGFTRVEILDYFETELNVPRNLIKFKVDASAEVNADEFVRYENYQINDRHDFTKGALTIIYKDSSLPNLIGMTEEEIVTLFEQGNYNVTLDFKQYFKPNGNNTFDKYISHQADETIKPGDIVSIYIATKEINLPSLKGLNKNQITELFDEMGVTLDYIQFSGDINTKLGVEEFIRYGDKLGNNSLFSPTITNKIPVVYNLSAKVPELEGLNKEQIREELKKANISSVKFEYILNNDKEYDSFASYGNKEAGEMINPSDTLTVHIYINDNVNDGDIVVHEEQIFISKYVDGKDDNKAIELYNPTNFDVDLSKYYIAILSDGSFVASYKITLTGILKAKSTYVIVNNKAVETLLDKGDLRDSDLQFDGNDTIQLRQVSNDTYIDSIYHVGNISPTLYNEVFVRREHINHGNRLFTQNDWFGFIPTYFEGVGTHPFTGDIRPKFNLISDKTFQEYGMTEVEVTSIADGDTVYANSLDPRDKTSYQGNNRLRFLLVDTPETEKPGQVGMPYANVATNFTRTMLNSASKIMIQSDPSSGISDTYGRHLALIWFKLDNNITFTDLKDKNGNSPVIEAGWSLLNYELVRLGLGEKMSGKTSGYEKAPIFSDRFLYSWVESALLFAKENELGLFSGVHMN